MVCTSVAAFDFARKLCDEYDRRKKDRLIMFARSFEKCIHPAKEEKDMNVRKEEKQTIANSTEGGVSPELSWNLMKQEYRINM